jgi:glycosyltransferase involved in cell wall biosynthesis
MAKRKRIHQILQSLTGQIKPQHHPGPVKTIAVCASQVPFFSGGAETHVHSLVDQLKSRGYEVELINIPYKWYPREQLLKSIQIWRLLDLSESNGKKIDMVISTKFPSYFVLWLIHQYRQMYDLLHTPYSGFDTKSRVDMRFRNKLVEMDTRALQSYPRIYTNARNTAQRLKKFNSIEAASLYHPPRMAGRYYCGDYKGYILSVGRLDALKRVDLFLRSLKDCDAKIKGKVVGTGPDSDRLKKMAVDLGLTERIEFLGFVPDEKLLELYADCRMVFFAPMDEDYGYITLEAFLSKKPVVTAFDSGGPLEFVEDGCNGIVLSDFNEKTMAERVESLFFDPEKCRKWGISGFQKVKDIHWDHVIDVLIKGN